MDMIPICKNSSVTKTKQQTNHNKQQQTINKNNNILETLFADCRIFQTLKTIDQEHNVEDPLMDGELFLCFQGQHTLEEGGKRCLIIFKTICK
jgi:hypothetical protein